MTLAKHYELGKLGEQVAVGYLLQKGYVILEKNWRYGNLEIDMIADDGEFLVMVEVKTRSSDEYGLPEESVDRDKRWNMINAAEVYLNRLHADLQVRFDIISIIMNAEETIVNHIEDAFYPGDEIIEELPGS